MILSDLAGAVAFLGLALVREPGDSEEAGKRRTASRASSPIGDPT
jgi:hypothetical protein